MFRLYAWLECGFHSEILSEYKGNDFKNLKLMKNFFFPSAAGPLLTLAQHCKGKQIPKLNTDLKIGRLLYLALRFSQEENKRAVTSEDVFPLHLDLKSQCWGSTRWVALFECTEISWTPGGLQKESPSAQGSRSGHSLGAAWMRSCVRDLLHIQPWLMSLENKLFRQQTRLLNTESRWPRRKNAGWQAHIKIWMAFWLVCSLLLHSFVPDTSPVRAENPAMFANTW